MLGYDVFVSYTRRDGRAFAQALTLKLIRDHDLVVFLDDHELDVGERLGAILRAVRRSKMLVLVATPRIGESDYVPQEIEAARRAKRRILPLDVGRTLEQRQAGATLTTLLQDEVWRTELNELAAGPADSTVRAIARSGRGLRRRSQLRILVGAIIAVLSALVLYAFFLSEQRARALELQTVKTDEARRLAFASRLLLAKELSAREPSRARLLLEDESACPRDLRDVAWALVHGDCDWRLWESPAAWEPQAHVGFLDDGRLACVTEQGTARFVDVATGDAEESASGQAGESVIGIDFAARVMALLREDDTLVVRAFDGDERARVAPAEAHRDLPFEYPWGTEVESAAFLDDGQTLATLSKTAVRFWDLASGEELRERRFDVPRRDDGPSDMLVAAAANPADRTELVVAVTTDWEDGHYASGLFRLAADGTWSESGVRQSSKTNAFAASTGGFALARRSSSGEASSEDGYLYFLVDAGSDLDTGDHRFPAGRGTLRCLALEGSAERLVFALQDGTVRILGARDGRAAVEWTRAFTEAGALAWDASGERLAVLHGSGVTVVRTSRPRPRATSTTDSRKSAKLHVLAQAGQDRLIHGWTGVELDTGSGFDVFDAATGEKEGETLGWLQSTVERVLTRDEVRPGEDGMRGIYAEVARTPFVSTSDGEWLATVGYRELDFVHLPTVAAASLEGEDRAVEEPMHPLSERTEGALRIAFAGTPARYALVRLSEEARAAAEMCEYELIDQRGPWLLELGAADGSGEVRELWRGEGRPQDLAFSPDGRWLAFADGVGPVRIWDADAREPSAVRAGALRAMRLVFSPDGGELAVLAEDVERAVELQVLRPGGRRARSVSLGLRGAMVLCFPQPERIVAGGADGAVAVFDRARSLVHLAPGPAGSLVFGLEASPSGATLLVSRLLADELTRCTLADGAFGHELFELTVAEAPVFGAALLTEGRGVLMIGADQGAHAWNAGSR